MGSCEPVEGLAGCPRPALAAAVPGLSVTSGRLLAPPQVAVEGLSLPAAVALRSFTAAIAAAEHEVAAGHEKSSKRLLVQELVDVYSTWAREVTSLAFACKQCRTLTCIWCGWGLD